MKKAKLEERRKFNNKIRNLKSNNPKEYWKILQGKHKENIEVGLGELFEHFRDLSEDLVNATTDTLEETPVIKKDNLDLTLLNKAITTDEIKKSVKNLKNGKSVGIDGIKNEHIKYSVDTLMPLYVLLFNKVLESGEIPQDWGVGLIIPIYKNKGCKRSE